MPYEKNKYIVCYIICCYGCLRLWKLLAGITGEKAGFVSAKGQKNETSDLFEVKDGVLIRYKGSYQTERKIILPESVKVIGKKAFSLNEKERCMIYKLKTSTLEIPPDVKIDEYAFSGAGPLKVTLAEGRKTVEKNAFHGMGKYGSDSEVILADSIEVIDEYAFYKGECVKVKLGSGLQRVKNMPEHLERLGTHCIRINKEGRVQISASVKYIAKMLLCGKTVEMVMKWDLMWQRQILIIKAMKMDGCIRRMVK